MAAHAAALRALLLREAMERAQLEAAQKQVEATKGASEKEAP